MHPTSVSPLEKTSVKKRRKGKIKNCVAGENLNIPRVGKKEADV